MNVFTILKNSTWEPLNLKCKRCDNELYYELSEKNIPIQNFACERIGCTWTHYYEHIKFIVEKNKHIEFRMVLK